MTGHSRRFAKLTVLSRAPARGRYKLVRCKCDCGAEIVVAERHLERGAVTSCGCGQYRQSNLAGVVVDGLKVASPADPIDGAPAVNAICTSCGATHRVKRGELLLGAMEICRCTHGREPQYRAALKGAWSRMLARCGMRESSGQINYAGRGITVCAGWRTSFDAFAADMGEPPSDDLSLDRIDNDGHYSCGRCDECKSLGWPANCRWATRSQQARNRRSPRRQRTVSGSAAG